MERISNSLRDYMDAAHFEVVCYGFLIDWAIKKGLEEEPVFDVWKEEFEQKRVECAAVNEFLSEAYPNGFEVGRDARPESFQDELRRLFPRPTPELIHLGGTHTKDVTIQVTEDCNMACTYCYQHNKKHVSMSPETGRKFIDYLFSGDPYVNDDSDGIILNFIGGEPFLEIGTIEELSDYFLEVAFKKHHKWAVRFMFSISSNGLLYFDDRVQAYLDRFAPHVSLSISVDGNKELHDSCRVDLNGEGTYDRALKAVRHYVNVRGGNIGSKMTIAPGNVGYVASAVRSLVEEGYRDIFLNCVFEEGWTPHHARVLYQQLVQLADYLLTLEDPPYVSMFDEAVGHPLSEAENKNWCGGTGLMLAVDRNGDLFPCLRYMGSSLNYQQEPYSIGNIETGVCNTERLHCLECITRRSQSTDECFNCPIASGCAWCSAHNYQVFGTPDKRATFICDMHKARVLANEYYWNKRGSDYSINIPNEWRVMISNGAD